MTTAKSKTQVKRIKIQMDDSYEQQASKIVDHCLTVPKEIHNPSELLSERLSRHFAEALRKLGEERDYFHDKFLETATTLQNFKAERDELKQKLAVAVEALDFYGSFLKPNQKVDIDTLLKYVHDNPDHGSDYGDVARAALKKIGDVE